jgi:hypothetical protein
MRQARAVNQEGSKDRVQEAGGKYLSVFGVMRRGGIWLFGCWALTVALLLPGLLHAEKGKPRLSTITVRAFHLLYPDYSQTFTVAMQEKVQLADTNLFVAIEEFVPHFAIDTVTHKVTSQSTELKNPAFKVVIYAGVEKKEEQWAFFKFAVPHFTRQTGLRFEVLKFDYNGKTYRRGKAK